MILLIIISFITLFFIFYQFTYDYYNNIIIKQNEIISELKSKNKYLYTYKKKASNTFKQLDNELKQLNNQFTQKTPQQSFFQPDFFSFITQIPYTHSTSANHTIPTQTTSNTQSTTSSSNLTSFNLEPFLNSLQNYHNQLI